MWCALTCVELPVPDLGELSSGHRFSNFCSMKAVMMMV